MTEPPSGDRKFIGFALPAFDSSQKVPHISREMSLLFIACDGTKQRSWSIVEPCVGAAAYLRGTITAKRSTVMRAFLLPVAFLIGLASPSRAADDVATAQGVIRSQVEALRRDDAAAAYSHAAPAIREIFPQADNFMAMVRGSYAPVYRHRSFEFGEARVADGRIAQRVHIVDGDGVAWEALYTLEQQPDGSLKITGCTLLKAGQAV